MCGISGVVGSEWTRFQLEAMVLAQHHRGPDATVVQVDATGQVGLGHNRLAIIDLTDAGRQPMCTPDGRFHLVFNGEVYNYLELRAELSNYPFSSRTDSEVLLAAYARWGSACLDRLIGMFAFAVWDAHERALFLARDRFGVKPLYYHEAKDGTLFFASEIKALHAAGVPREPNVSTWATYLSTGVHEHDSETFWTGIRCIAPGSCASWRNGRLQVREWYRLLDHVSPETDRQPLKDLEEEYGHLLREAVDLRFRSDVPVGLNLSGGVDSSALFALVQQLRGSEVNLHAFTFVTGDARYDELPWVRRMLAGTAYESVPCELRAAEIPELAADVQRFQDEPFGGIPTLTFARLFERAREHGVIVLLDGQGLDEQWAGYDYYQNVMDGVPTPVVQGTSTSAVRPDCLLPEFAALATPFEPPTVFPDRLRNMQYRDTRYVKLPRVLRFLDRVSMRVSTELREPFLDHRLFELAFQQSAERKLPGGGKWFLRHMLSSLLPGQIVSAPKRPVQTPQREWLRGELASWARDQVEVALTSVGGTWLDRTAVHRAREEFATQRLDNSYFLWQWINLALLLNPPRQNAKVWTSHAGAGVAVISA